MTILNKKPRTKFGDCKNSKNQCKSVVWDCRNRRTKIAQRVLLKQIFRKKIEKKSQQSVVSIHGPLGYGPSTLPLRHSALLNTLTFYPSRYLYICCLKNPIFFRNCKNSIHDCRQIVCAKFQTCNVTRHRFTYPCLPSP